MKAFWRLGGDGLWHLYVRTGKNSRLGMNFSTLCGREWADTIKYNRPRPYPPPLERRCEACGTSIPKGCKT